MFVALLVIATLVNAEIPTKVYSVVKRNKYMVVEGKVNDAISYGSYEDTHMTKGWGVLRIETVDKYKPVQQAFAAGFLEGYLTKHLIKDYWDNFKINEYGKSGPSRSLDLFLTKQYLWWSEQCKTNKTEFWREQNLILKQFRGLLSGYNQYCDYDKKMSVLEMYYVNAAGDLGTLNKLVKNHNLPKYSTISMEKMNRHEIFHECTSMVRVLPDNSDVVFSHNTWRPYYAMMRIYKIYNLKYTTNAHPMTFASSPGFLHSKDDFYILATKGNKFSVMETTNSVFDNSLFRKYITFQSALSWQRIIGGMYYGKTPREVLTIFKQYNSGTYNNQWIVTNLNVFKPGQDIPKKNFVLIGEQIPGRVMIKDVSSIVAKKGYWASYNVPHIKEIRRISGYIKRQQDFGDRYSYERCPRRRIFDRDAGKTNTIEDVKKFMEFNKFQTDPLTEGKSGWTIAARYDLDSSRPSPFGAVDCKLGSYKLGTSAWIINGPTHDDQPPFVWSDSIFTDVVHKNCPDKFDFNWILVKDTLHQ